MELTARIFNGVKVYSIDEVVEALGLSRKSRAFSYFCGKKAFKSYLTAPEIVKALEYMKGKKRAQAQGFFISQGWIEAKTAETSINN